MKCPSLVLFSLICSFTFGQELSLHIPITPDKRSDNGIQMKILDDGYLIAGVSFCLESSNDECLGLLKVDKQGKKVWSHVFDGSPDSGLGMEGLTLVLISDTAYIATEIWKSDHKEIRVMSFNMEGDLTNQIDLAIPYTTSLWPRGMIQADNKLLIYGEVGNNGNKIFIEEIDFQLNFLKEHLIGNPSFDKRLMEMNRLKDGGYVFAYGEAVTSPETSVVIVKLDEDFNINFSKKILQSGDPFTSVNIYETDDKGFMLSWQKNLKFSLSDTFPFPTTIYKLDSVANVEWEYVFAHKSAKQHISTVKVTDGKMLGIGATDYYSVFNIYPERWLDGWCFLIDTEGDLLWERIIADIQDTFGGRLWYGLEDNERFVLVGDIDKLNPSGTPFLNDPEVWFLTLDENGCWNGNCNDYIIITSDATSITDVNEATLFLISSKTFPNPTSGILTIECHNCNSNMQRKVEVFDINSMKVLDINLYASKSTINLSHLNNGTYLVLQSINGQLIDSQKIIVHH